MRLRSLGMVAGPLFVTLFLSGSEQRRSLPQSIDMPETGNYAAAISTGGSLRVVSWNIDRGYRADRVAAVLRDKGPGLCLLQEVDSGDRRTGGGDVARDLARMLGYNYVFGAEFEELSQKVDGKPAYHGQATLSRWPLVHSRILRFDSQSNWWQPHRWIPDTPFFQRRLGGRIALVTEVSIGGDRLVLYNVHLESRSGGVIQTAQLNEVLADLAHYRPGTTAIVGGDFNSKYHPYELLHSMEERGFQSALGEKVERTHVIVGYLDWVFYRGPWHVSGGQILRGTHASDHDAVMTDLTE